MSSYTDIDVEQTDGVTTITINRPEQGNKFTNHTALELADAFRRFRGDITQRVAVLTGAGDKFFCIGGEHESTGMLHHADVMPIVDVYELIDSVPKPVIAAVNGFAVGGGQVLHTVCDLTIAADHAIFRQVGPMVGSFDAGYGTWYLEEVVGRKRAKEIWYLNQRYTAEQALAIGLVNEVVPGADLQRRVREIADTLIERGPVALAGLKSAFSSRHTGVVGQARMAHDLMLTMYLATDEAHEVSAAFKERRSPDQQTFWR
jgi:naphthoate synthase